MAKMEIRVQAKKKINVWVGLRLKLANLILPDIKIQLEEEL